jgi:hypothetical protein
MNTEASADLIMNEIKKREILNISDNISLEGVEIKAAFSEFTFSYDMAQTKACTFDVPVKTKFRFLKRIINKLIRFNTKQQVEFNYNVLGLIKAQHDIIIKNQNMLTEFMLKNKEFTEK